MRSTLLTAVAAGAFALLPLGAPPAAQERAAALTPAEQAADAGEPWWSLRPLERPPVPAVKGAAWVRNPIDAFVLAKLEEKGLSPSASADRATYIRRVTYDLHGLPPTPEEVAAFLNDPSPEAFAKLVDRLLASPRYGERWGRHWLDLIHYADTHGFDKDKRRLWAWLFRDWIIRALNRDLPYRRFVRRQLAGDVLTPDDPDGVIATGFVVAGPWDFVGHVELREGTVDKEKTRLLDRDDMVTSTMSTFVSMTAHCARCHDHKFDPIPQKDYYRLQAVFAGVERGDRPLYTPEIRRQAIALEQQRRAAADRKAALEARIDPQTRAELARAKAELAVLDARLKALKASALVYAVVPRPPRPIHVLHRGDVEKKRTLVGPGALSLVPGLRPEFALARPEDEGSRRLALADWITDPKNVLTWRSIVNRVWQYHFGRGIVDTPNDFGKNGALPTHPELLDWLAVEFRDGGQSLKKLHGLIVLSNAYRQSSQLRIVDCGLRIGRPGLFGIPRLAWNPQSTIRNPQLVDADNRYLWRMNRQRLDAESVRDSVLAVSGKLDLTMGGPGFALFRFKDDHSPVYDHSDLAKVNDPATYRRTVYRFVVRSVPNPFLECLDCADPNLNVPVRNTTLTALQALALLNNPFMVKQAEYFARRLEAASRDRGRQVELAYRLAFGRPPTAEERATVSAYARRHGLANACRVLLNSNEFLFVD
jgi:hypothetical protein